MAVEQLAGQPIGGSIAERQKVRRGNQWIAERRTQILNDNISKVMERIDKVMVGGRPLFARMRFKRLKSTFESEKNV